MSYDGYNEAYGPKRYEVVQPSRNAPDFEEDDMVYDEPPDILFGDQRREIECSFRVVSEEEEEERKREYKEDEEYDCKYVEVDENPINERSKIVNISGSDVLSNDDNNKKKAKAPIRRYFTKKQAFASDSAKFPGDISKKNKTKTKLTNPVQVKGKEGKMKSNEDEDLSPTVTECTRKGNIKNEIPGNVGGVIQTAGVTQVQKPKAMETQQISTQTTPTAPVPPPPPLARQSTPARRLPPPKLSREEEEARARQSQSQVERMERKNATEKLRYQEYLNSVNMEVENHAQRKHLRGILIQAVTESLVFKVDEQQELRQHRIETRKILFSQPGITLITNLFGDQKKEQNSSEPSASGSNPFLFDSIIQH